MEIIKATKDRIHDIARLFDLYRQFYDCDPDIDLATRFISDRIENNESTIFIALHDGNATGFVQLYPSFCSVDAVKIFILHDLYVDSDARRTGTGLALMNTATQYAKEKGASRIDLLTATTNRVGQRLYEKLGYRKVLEDYYSYSLAI